MKRLRAAGRFFYAKGECAGVVLDQLVTLAFANALFKLSNFAFKMVYASQRRALALSGLKRLLIQGDYLSPEVRDLQSQFIGRRRDLRLIQRLAGCSVCTCGLTEPGNHAHNVHSSSPGIEKGGVGTPDSTSGGNAQEEANA